MLHAPVPAPLAAHAVAVGPLLATLLGGGLADAAPLPAPAGGLSLVGWVVGGAGLALAALFGNSTGNDDDDSSPGGGLMQPVAGAA